MSGGQTQMYCTMSAVTNQPLTFGRLEREKHIEMIFRAFQNRCGPSCDCNTQSSRPKPHETSPRQDSDEPLSGLARGRKILNSNMQQMGRLKMSEPEEPGGTDCLSVLDTVGQIHITARPELQGPQCVPRRIYNITSEGTRLPLFVAVEESSCICLQCCGPARACSLRGFNCKGRQVFYLERPFKMDACCFGCCLMEMRVYTPQKHLIGSICQRWSMFTPLLEVCDSNGASAIRIQGSCCPCRCFSNQQFQIVSNIGENIGTIWKRWPGFNEERNTDHEYFGLDVPPGMESHTKLLLLAATFLLSHMFFEMS